jgi:Zn-finger nucleic acid-binding protein
MMRCPMCGAEMEETAFNGYYFFVCPECGCWEERE